LQLKPVLNLKRHNMAKMKVFTNASQSYYGDSIAINADIVASVFELIEPDKEGKLQPHTIIYGVNNIDWRVKEPYLEVLAILNSD
jgi:hypothetical protein